MAKRRRSGLKGSFGEPRLPVARSYPPQASRRRMVVLGAAVAAVVVAAVAWDRLAGGSELISGGPLSSSHAVFAGDCGHCHDARSRSASDRQCAVCHEKAGDGLGIHTFAAHYLYRSDDFRRVVPSEHETPCSGCHGEHRGRDAAITRVDSGACRACHFADFGAGHPEFDFAAEAIPDSGALRFPHTHHLREVMKREQLADPERACLYCHQATADGRNFQPLDFDRHCDACHLDAATATPGLPLAGATDGPGVLDLEQLAADGGPGLRWVYFSNPAELRRRGSLVVKAPVHHRDPWVLENLRRLRRRLYPDAGLADLLRVSADAPPHAVRELYLEAVATLEEQAEGLRGRPEPEVQQQLAAIRQLVAEARRRIEQPLAPLDETSFLLALDRRDPALPAAEAAAIERLGGELTEPCRRCHLVRDLTIVRVETDQRQLRRAEFDHRAHVVQRRCLDCHDVIPMRQFLESGEPVPAELDRSEIQNLPTIATCRECHEPRQAADRCVTCHRFHPDRGQRAELLPYTREAP